jgi:glycosyltransferase involved in cell wall biosynthesis
MNITATPEVSICLTTYNRASSLSKTIDSLLAQKFTNFELIICDDNSSDNTQALCLEYVNRDQRVQYHRNPQNLKMPGNLNKSISLAKGEYIANLHDGDIYQPDLIQKWYNNIIADAEILFVFNQYESVDEAGKRLCIYDHHLAAVNDGKVIREYLYRTLSSGPWGTVMARRSAYEKFGFFDPQFGFISDVEMWMRLSTKGKVGYVSEPLIELTPREREHVFFLPHWKITFLNLKIIYLYHKKTGEYKIVSKEFIQGKIKNNLTRITLSLFRKFQWQRFREFLYMIFKSPFTGIKLLFIPLLIFGIKKPQEFNDKEWMEICRL